MSRVDVQLNHARPAAAAAAAAASLFSRAQLTTRARALPAGTLLSSKP